MSVNVRVTAVNKKRLDSLGTAELLLPSGCAEWENASWRSAAKDTDERERHECTFRGWGGGWLVFSYILEGCVVDADNDGPSFYIVYSHVAIHIQYILTLAMVGGAARTAAREGGGKITQSEERERGPCAKALTNVLPPFDRCNSPSNCSIPTGHEHNSIRQFTRHTRRYCVCVCKSVSSVVLLERPIQ
jgi:hypothetical protein